MFAFFQLLVAVLAATHIRSASAFQPGSDYNISKTTSLYNCTGHTPVSNVTVRNAFDTLPQIDSSSGRGWEQWTLFFQGTFQFVLRWNTGNPSSSTVPSPPHFDIIVNISGFHGESTMVGDFSYTDDGQTKQIAIGDNKLTWDSEGLWYNASINIDDYHIEMNSFSETLDTFHPNLALYNGLLDQSGQWFGSVPIVRGYLSGTFTSPTLYTVPIEGISVMRHMFSENPLPSYINKYSGGAIWGYSESFYDTHVFYHTETTSGSVHEAAFLGRALPLTNGQDGFSSAWGIYGVTDDKLYTLSVDPLTNGISASFSGCSDTNTIPYQFNATTLTLLGAMPDLGGGLTTYYTLNGTTSAAFGGVAADGFIAGIFEEYQAPLVQI